MTAEYKMTKVEDIRPYDRNPRVIPASAVDAVAKSIQAFGFRQPIVVDDDGVILAGHTRYKAAVQLGLTEVPVVWQRGMSQIQARGYRIADNKTAEISCWDRDLLVDEASDMLKCDKDALKALECCGLPDWELEKIIDASGILPKYTEPAPKAIPAAKHEAEKPESVQWTPGCNDNPDEAKPVSENKSMVLFLNDEQLTVVREAVAVTGMPTSAAIVEICKLFIEGESKNA